MANRKQAGRSQPASRGRRQAKKPRRRRKGRRTLHHILLVLVLVAAGIALSLTVFFKIEDIVVIGNEHYTPEEIIQVTGIALEDNLFLVDTHQIEQELLATFPYLEEVSVKRAYPPAIEIHTTPSVAVAALEQAANDYILITYQGKILEQGLALPPWDALLVHGVPIEQAAPGDFLGEYHAIPPQSNESDDQKKQRQRRNEQLEQTAEDQAEVLRMLHYLFEAMEETGFDTITNIDLTDRYNMSIRYENRLLLALGTEIDLTNKLRFAQHIMENNLVPDALGTIDLSSSRQGRASYFPPEGYTKDEMLQVAPLHAVPDGETIPSESPEQTEGEQAYDGQSPEDLSPPADTTALDDTTPEGTPLEESEEVQQEVYGQTQPSVGGAEFSINKEEKVIIPLEDLE